MIHTRTCLGLFIAVRARIRAEEFDSYGVIRGFGSIKSLEMPSTLNPFSSALYIWNPAGAQV